MRFDPGGMLERLRPWIPPELVTPEALARVSSVARLLSPASCCGMECRLGEGSTRVDFMACATVEDGSRELLAAHGASLVRSAPAWSRVAELSTSWATPGSPLHERVPVLWLEFDLETRAGSAEPLVPLPFICVQPRFLKEPPTFPAPSGSPARQETLQLAREALRLLLGQSLPSGFGHTLATCAGQLPETGHLLHVAPLVSRSQDALRLVLTLPGEALPDYLGRVGWPGAPARVRELVTALATFSSHPLVHLDVADAVLPTLGLGFFHPAGDARWRLLLEALVSLGACTPGKRDALLRWPGETELLLPGHRWPSRMRRTLEVKVIHRPGEPLEAKAYLLVDCQLSLVPPRA